MVRATLALPGEVFVSHIEEMDWNLPTLLEAQYDREWEMRKTLAHGGAPTESVSVQ